MAKKINTPIYVTKSFLPPISEYKKYLKIIWETNRLTNQGPLLKQLESELAKLLDVKYLHFVTNGTVALQLALNGLGITEGEIITTPFSYVATTSSILWERCKPIFVDIDEKTLCIDPHKIEEKITKDTKAIMAVHVFGNPCNVELIQKIAKKHNLKVIYDGAHAFGVKYKSKSLLSYGDISTCSFHATKVFHTVEGGCIITNNKSVSDKIELIKRFGHHNDDHSEIGINAKASEFHAAMGLCNLKYVDKIINNRKDISKHYDRLLSSTVQPPYIHNADSHNYAYYPVIFNSEKQTIKVIRALNDNNIFPRRYFYPSLNTIPYLNTSSKCSISEDISRRILCLPLYKGLANKEIQKISKIVISSVNK